MGPNDLLELIKTVGKGNKISTSKDVMCWVGETEQVLDYDNAVIATYVVDLRNNLLVADRHSEHVVCAGGENVLSAGEITFCIDDSRVKVVEVTNQSTGYCPKPESWSTVKNALIAANIDRPNNFTRKFIFRVCEKCNLLNVVKEEWFVCVQCNEELNKLWNIS